MHAIVVLLEKRENPLKLLLGRKRSVLVKGHRNRLVAEQFKIATYVEHFLLADRVVTKSSLATNNVVILGVKVPPKELVMLLRWYIVVKSLDGTE